MEKIMHMAHVGHGHVGGSAATAARTSSPLDRSLIKHSLPLRGGVRPRRWRLAWRYRGRAPGGARRAWAARRGASACTTISHTRSVTPRAAASASKPPRRAGFRQEEADGEQPEEHRAERVVAEAEVRRRRRLPRVVLVVGEGHEEGEREDRVRQRRRVPQRRELADEAAEATRESHLAAWPWRAICYGCRASRECSGGRGGTWRRMDLGGPCAGVRIAHWAAASTGPDRSRRLSG